MDSKWQALWLTQRLPRWYRQMGGSSPSARSTSPTRTRSRSTTRRPSSTTDQVVEHDVGDDLYHDRVAQHDAKNEFYHGQAADHGAVDEFYHDLAPEMAPLGANTSATLAVDSCRLRRRTGNVARLR